MFYNTYTCYGLVANEKIQGDYRKTSKFKLQWLKRPILIIHRHINLQYFILISLIIRLVEDIWLNYFPFQNQREMFHFMCDVQRFRLQSTLLENQLFLVTLKMIQPVSKEIFSHILSEFIVKKFNNHNAIFYLSIHVHWVKDQETQLARKERKLENPEQTDTKFIHGNPMSVNWISADLHWKTICGIL